MIGIEMDALVNCPPRSGHSNGHLFPFTMRDNLKSRNLGVRARSWIIGTLFDAAGLHLDSLDHIARRQDPHSYVSHLLPSPIVQARDGIVHQCDPKIPLTGLVDRRAGTIGKVAAANHERTDLHLRKVLGQRSFVEGSPSRLVNSHLIIPYCLYAPIQ